MKYYEWLSKLPLVLLGFIIKKKEEFLQVSGKEDNSLFDYIVIQDSAVLAELVLQWGRHYIFWYYKTAVVTYKQPHC